jgi:hypothetical protein
VKVVVAPLLHDRGALEPVESGYRDGSCIVFGNGLPSQFGQCRWHECVLQRKDASIEVDVNSAIRMNYIPAKGGQKWLNANIEFIASRFGPDGPDATLDDQIKTILDDYGAKGWELVQVLHRHKEPEDLIYRLIFKTEKPLD